jgi:hypothetical protein
VKAKRCHESSDELLGLICTVLDDKTLCAESRSDLAKLVVVCKFVFVKVVLERNPKKLFHRSSDFLGHPATHVTRFGAPESGLAFGFPGAA